MSLTRVRDVVTIIAAMLAAFVLVGVPTASAATPGYTWIYKIHRISKQDGIDPAGLKVYVVRGSHTSELTSATKYAISQQRRYGIPVIWAGYAVNSTYRAGAIVVHQGGQCDGAIAVGGPWVDITTVQNVVKVVGGDVSICSNAAFTHGRTVLREILLHEMGHVAGLDHYTASYHGRLQIMYPIMQGVYDTYQDGDIAGLRAIAANTAKLGRANA